MKTIDLSEATWQRLQRRAVPLEDSPEDVVNRLLDEFEAANANPVNPQTPIAAAMQHKTLQSPPRASDHVPPRTGPQPKRGRRAPHTDVVLRGLTLIGPGTVIAVTFDCIPYGADRNAKTFTAKFANDSKHVIWDLDGQEYSISALSMLLAQRHGVKAGTESENGFRIFGLASNRGESLEELRKRLEGRS